MYYIVNYKTFWRFDKIFNDFNSAFMRYQLLNDLDNIIEYYTKDYERVIVWDREMSEIDLNSLNPDYDKKYNGITWIN